MWLRKIKQLSLLFIAITLAACSKYGKVEGKVVDKITNKPIAGATATIKGTILSSSTDTNGKFVIKEVVPGTQKLAVTKDGYISISEAELTVAKGTTSKVASVFLVQKPLKPGLYKIGDSLQPISMQPESTFGRSMNMNLIIEDAKLHNITPVEGQINLLLYEGENPIKSDGIMLYPMKFFPAGVSQMGFFAFRNPSRWVQQEAVTNGIKVEKLSPELTLISGQQEPGRYCLGLKHQSGVQDWFFVFDLKTGSSSETATKPQAISSAGQPAKINNTDLPSRKLTTFSHGAEKTDHSTVVGIIKAADFQGNNYLMITLTPANKKKDIKIWCSGGKTSAYASSKKVVWTELTPGRKIKVVGNWVSEDGGKQLSAIRIDLQ